jgi:hypothetical protein
MARCLEGSMAEPNCPHEEAGIRLNELSEVEICMCCGIEIEGLDANEAGGEES